MDDARVPSRPRQTRSNDEHDTLSIEDENFDRVYPPRIRRLSAIFWTPVAVAAEAASWLVRAPGTRVLDIGCGAGKFCLVGASLSEGNFTGIEQRADLIDAARTAAAALGLGGVTFCTGNVVDYDFAGYDAFYLFNPFEENLHGHKIDAAISPSPDLFFRSIRHVADQLGRRPLGTRVVTYMGYAEEIPDCYDCVETRGHDALKFWIKQREYDPQLARLGLGIGRSHRGANGWAPPRRGR